MSFFLPAFLALAFMNGLWAYQGRHAARRPSRGARIALALVVPIGLAGSILDCMGLSFRGCTPVCAVLMKGVAPAVSLLALVHLATRAGGPLTIATGLSFAFFIPNCVCYNPVSGPWIDLWGRSPACFGGAVAIATVAIGALRTGRFVPLAIAFTWISAAALWAFFVGHRFFRFPW